MSARKMKDSGIEWIGEIPENWKVTKIKHLLSIPITDGPHETPEILDDGIPFISAEAVKNLKINFDLKRGFISQIDHERFCKKCKPQFGDIFIVKSGATTGNIARVDTHKEFSVWSPLALIRVKNEAIKRDFMFYFLQSNLFRLQVELFWSYGTQQNIGMEVLENLYAPYPSIGMQQKIVEYLDEKCGAIDKVVRSKQKQNEQLAEYRQSLITEAVTNGLNPAAPMKDSGIEWIEEIPEKWEIKKVKYLFSVVNGATPKSSVPEYWDGDIMWITPADMSFEMFEIKDSRQKITAAGLASCGTTLVPKGSIVISTRAPIGQICIAGKELCTNQGCKTLVCFEELCNEYFYYYLKVQAKVLNMLGRGTTFLELSSRDLGDFLLPLPPLSEQKAIAAYLDKKCGEIDALSERNKNIIESLREYKQSLIYEAVTGKIEL